MPECTCVCCVGRRRDVNASTCLRVCGVWLANSHMQAWPVSRVVWLGSYGGRPCKHLQSPPPPPPPPPSPPAWCCMTMRTSVLVCVPIVHRLTFLSSPPVTSTPHDLRPILTQFTLGECARNSSAGEDAEWAPSKHDRQSCGLAPHSRIFRNRGAIPRSAPAKPSFMQGKTGC